MSNISVSDLSSGALILGGIFFIVIIISQFILVALHSLTNKKIFWKLLFDNILEKPKGMFEISIAILLFVAYFISAFAIYGLFLSLI